MIYLDRTTRKLEIVLGGAPAATAPKATGFCFDVPQQQKTDFSSYQGAAFPVTSNGTTPVTIVAAPTVNGTVRNVDGVHVAQLDSGALVVTIQIDEGGTKYPLFSQSVAAGKTVVYEHGQGWAIV